MLAWMEPQQAGMLVLLALFIAVAAWWILTGKPAGPDPLEKLLRERLGVLEKILAQVEKASRAGQSDFSALHGATVAVLQAKLELAKTPAERAKLHEGLVEQARRRCEFLQQQQDPTAGGLEGLRAKLTIVDARIALGRAEQQYQQARATAQSKGRAK